MNIDADKKAADNIRILAMSMVEKSKSGHPGGAMGGADFINLLHPFGFNIVRVALWLPVLANQTLAPGKPAPRRL